MEQTKRTCLKCGCSLASQNPNSICDSCQRAVKKNSFISKESYDERYYDLEDIRERLGLDSYEQARRKAQRGEIPGRVPGRRQYLFDKQTINNWLPESFNDGLPRKLAEETDDALAKAGEFAEIIERRMPLKRVVESFEKQYPIEDVVKKIMQFIQVAPPPDVVLNDIIHNFIKR